MKRSLPVYRTLLLAATLATSACSNADDSPPSPPAPATAEQSTPSPHAAARTAMVERQLKAPGRDITNPRVLQAMAEVPRHEFVPVPLRHEAYRDSPLPIGHQQTISQPFIVAFMTEQLDPQPGDKVLEIGTGSGYQAAILAKLVKEVYSIEIVEPLAHEAAQILKRLDFQNVHVKAGDGYQGWPEHAPFDAIIVTCAPDHIPQPLVDQLKEGGRMMIPVGNTFAVQELCLLEKHGGKIVQKSILPVRFVPMTGQSQDKDAPLPSPSR